MDSNIVRFFSDNMDILSVDLNIISTLVTAILIKVVLKLLFMLEFGYYVTIYGFKQ